MTALTAFSGAREPIRRNVRRLRWFRRSFAEQVALTSAETGVAFRVDDPALAAAFIDWLRAFDAQKPEDRSEYRGYVGFAAGLLLRTLIKRAPVAAGPLPEGADRTEPRYFWPEGFLYTSYCVNVRTAVLDQDFHEDARPSPEFSNIDTWRSFHENVREDASRAIAFLDLFSGDQPNWSSPSIFRSGEVRRISAELESAAAALSIGQG